MLRPTEHEIIITASDRDRLASLLAHHEGPTSESLDRELHRAVIVDPRAVPPDVVTMNSEVTYEDCATRVRRTIRIVYPHDADAAASRISVLAPIGSALLGLRVGQAIEWPVPSGKKSVRVVEVRDQPEANGDFAR